MTQNRDLIELVILMRFGPSQVRDTKRPLISLAAIARALRLAHSTVCKLVRIGVTHLRKKTPIIQLRKSKLTETHLRFLLESDTLKAWAHLSLKQRVVMFHRQFPELSISSSLLQRTYKKHGIKFKYIKRGKKSLDYASLETRAMFDKMYQLVKLVQLYEWKLVFVDEAVFSFNTFLRKPGLRHIRV